MLAIVLQNERESRRIFTALLGHVRSVYSFLNFSIVADYIFGVGNAICWSKEKNVLSEFALPVIYYKCNYLFSHFDKRSCHFKDYTVAFLDKKY